VLEKDEEVVGRTRINGGSAELEGGATVYLYGMQAFALAIVVHYIESLSCTMAVSDDDCGLDAGCVRRHELYARAVKPSPAPNPSRFSGVAERLAKVLYSHTATPPQI
jgi:hypothetical protein